MSFFNVVNTVLISGSPLSPTRFLAAAWKCPKESNRMHELSLLRRVRRSVNVKLE